MSLLQDHISDQIQKARSSYDQRVTLVTEAPVVEKSGGDTIFGGHVAKAISRWNVTPDGVAVEEQPKAKPEKPAREEESADEVLAELRRLSRNAKRLAQRHGLA